MGIAHRAAQASAAQRQAVAQAAQPHAFFRRQALHSDLVAQGKRAVPLHIGAQPVLTGVAVAVVVQTHIAAQHGLA